MIHTGTPLQKYSRSENDVHVEAVGRAVCLSQWSEDRETFDLIQITSPEDVAALIDALKAAATVTFKEPSHVS